MKKYWEFVGLIVFVFVLLHGCYAPPPPTSGPGGTTPQPFSLRVSVPKSTYRVGENIVISVRATQSCYLTLYDISTQGEVTQIFPNQFAVDNFIEGGYPYPIPDQKDNFDFEIIGPGGTERVRAVCTIENVNLLDSRKVDTSQAYPRIRQDARGDFDKSLDAKLQVIPSERWTEASVTFTVIE